MVPGKSDVATELFHWQRYLYFRPWYDDAMVVDAASGEGYGTGFISTYASSAIGIDLCSDAVAHGSTRYSDAKFDVHDVTTFDYSNADLVVSFETIEHVPDPVALLKAYGACSGRIVISTPNRKTHSPGNSLNDKPLNSFHTVEWTPNEFAELIRENFPDRQVRFLSQEGRWPGLITEGLDDDAMYCIAVIGDGELPKWPSIGLAIPTVDNVAQAQETLVHFSRFYPGQIRFAVVCNGSSEATISKLKEHAQTVPYMLEIIESKENLGYGRGANIGLDWLRNNTDCELFGVSNDDVVPGPSTLPELVSAFSFLQDSGMNPGMIGPMSNEINGLQKVETLPITDLESLLYSVEAYHKQNHGQVVEHFQIRGLFFLMTKECLDTVGGFDPRFNYGNFEDDDLNLRCKLAGYTLWLAQGSLLFHHGSQTFAQLLEGSTVRYAASLERNKEIFKWKWDLMEPDQWPMVSELPAGVELQVPLDATYPIEYAVNMEGQTFDLYSQLSDIEFVKWVYDRLQVRDRSARREVVKALVATQLTSAVAEVQEPKQIAV